MRPENHVKISIISAIGIYFITGSFFLSLLNAAIGVFIDMDHLLDFICSKPKSIFDIKEFLNVDFIFRNRKVYLILHSYELLILLIIVSILGLLEFHFAISVFSAVLFHLVADQIGNPVKPFTYFIFYRIYHNFDLYHLINLEKEYKEKN